MDISAAEQYFIELTNRARLDPEAEAERLGIGLNEGLAPGTIDGSAKQVLAPSDWLEIAAVDHSEWMLANDTFSHYGVGGSDPGDRIADAGYIFSGSWAWGENLALLSGSSIDLEYAIGVHYRGLFKSEGHRENTMSDAYREIGIGQVAGDFENSDASVLTTTFAKSGSLHFLTGVAYNDLDGDGFYSMGEGVSGVGFLVSALGGGVGGAAGQNTAAAGGYSVPTEADANAFVYIFGHNNAMSTLYIDLSEGNAKLDLVNGDTVQVSRDTTLDTGVANARLLGIDDLALTGNGDANKLEGNRGANVIDGLAGADTIDGGDGQDTLSGGDGNDVLRGGKSGDTLLGEGNADRLFGEGGADVMGGGAGNDVLRGQLGGDAIYGGSGRDKLFGGAGNDNLFGGAGNDTLLGGGGDDRLVAGKGGDRLIGGVGDDEFVFADKNGWNLITDFDALSGGEVLNFAGVAAFTSAADVLSNHATQVGTAVVIADDDGLTVRLANVDLADLDASDFLF